MPTRALLILAVVTVIAVGASLSAVDQRYRGTALSKHAGGLVFPQFQSRSNGVTEIDVARASSRFNLARRGEQWDNMGIGGFPTRPGRVQSVLGDMAALRLLEPKTERPALHHKLDIGDVIPGARSTRLTFKDEAGAVIADLIVGKAKDNVAGIEGAGVYVRRPGDDRAWLAKGSPDVHHDAAAWSDTSVADIKPDALISLTVRHADGGVVDVHRRQPDDRKLTLKNPPAGAPVEHQHQIDYLAGLLQDLRFTNARRTDTTGGEPHATIEATARTRDGLAVTLRVDETSDDGSVWVRVDAQVTEDAETSQDAIREAAKIRSKFSGWSVRLPRTVKDRLDIRLSDIVETTTTNERPSP